MQGIATQQQRRTQMEKFQEAVGDSFARMNEQGALRSLNQTLKAIDQSNNTLLASQVFGSTYQGKDYNQQNRQSTLDNYYADSVRYYNGTVDAINQGISAGNKVRETLAMQVAMTKRRYQIGDNNARMDRAAYEYAFNRGIAGGIVDMNDEATRRMWAMNQKDDFAEFVKNGVEYSSYLLGGGGVMRAGIGLGLKGLGNLAKGNFVSGVAQGFAAHEAVSIGWNVVSDSASAVYLGNDVYSQHKSFGSGIIAQSIDNGGFTLSTGLAGAVDVGARASGAGGLWMAMDFETMSFDGGLYYGGELGSKVGLPVPSFSFGSETTFFTSPNFDGALRGAYTLQGGTYGDFELSQIQAYSGSINGYQVTKEVWGKSVNSLDNPGLFAHYGYGDYIKLTGRGKN